MYVGGCKQSGTRTNVERTYEERRGDVEKRMFVERTANVQNVQRAAAAAGTAVYHSAISQSIAFHRQTQLTCTHIALRDVMSLAVAIASVHAVHSLYICFIELVRAISPPTASAIARSYCFEAHLLKILITTPPSD